MALPLIRDLRAAWPDTEILVAARASVEPLFSMVPGVNGTVTLQGGGGRRAIQSASTNAARLADTECDAALLLPNSFLSAWIVRRAGIPERWGFARDLRRRLLTRPVPSLRRYGHQVEYYQALGTALGIPAGRPYAHVAVPATARARAVELLTERGLMSDRFVVFAPGAAYGRAKQWLPERFVELARLLSIDGVKTVLVGAKGDTPVCAAIAAIAPVLDLSGQTDLPLLAGVLTHAHAVVANDSGAMHLAAAVGARVTALFGPTDDRKTRPLAASEHDPHPTVVSTDVWCRPCMLRECPIDHRCMTRISADRVRATLPVQVSR